MEYVFAGAERASEGLVMFSLQFCEFFYHEGTVATAAGGKYKCSGQQQDAGMYESHIEKQFDKQDSYMGYSQSCGPL